MKSLSEIIDEVHDAIIASWEWRTRIDATSPFSINWSYEGPAFFINFAPSITEPLLQNMTNTNFMGNPIAKKPYSNRQAFEPKFKQVFRSTSPTLIELFRALNRVGGGDDEKIS